MIQKSTLLKRLESAGDSGPVRRVTEWLRSPATEFVTTRTARQTVSELLRLWRTRVENVSVTKFPLDGAEALISTLEQFQPQHLVEQYALHGVQSYGTLFFLASSEQFLGAVIVPEKQAVPLAS